MTEPVYRVLLLSGGVDSTALLVSEKFGEPTDLCLFVDYGQPAWVEEAAASRRMADRFDCRWQSVKVAPVKRGRMDDAPGTPGPRVVQGRNLLLIAAAVNHCDGPGAVYLGAHRGDADLYPDCRGEFVSGLSLASGEAYGIAIVAPHLHRTRAEIQDLLKGVGIELSACWSCYAPNNDGTPCGECDSCKQGPQ